MGPNEIEGFRRLRTISQLIFEGIPQIFLLIRVYIYFYNEINEHPAYFEAQGISLYGIFFSLMCAVLHFILEGIQIKLDAKACKTDVLHISLVYLNGRLGWVPFSNKFIPDGSQPLDTTDLFDYDCIKSKLCGGTVNVDFEFDNGTCEGLIKLIGSLPIELKKEKQMNLKLGQSIQNVSFTNFLKLLDTAFNRV